MPPYLLVPLFPQSSGWRCALLEQATARYLRVLQTEVQRTAHHRSRAAHSTRASSARARASRTDPLFRGYLTALQVEVQHCDAWPAPGMDESCTCDPRVYSIHLFLPLLVSSFSRSFCPAGALFAIGPGTAPPRRRARVSL